MNLEMSSKQQAVSFQKFFTSGQLTLATQMLALTKK